MKKMIKKILTLKSVLILSVFTTFIVESNTEQVSLTIDDLTYNDISILWAPPEDSKDLEQMIGADLAVGAERVKLWPKAAFRAMLNKAAIEYPDKYFENDNVGKYVGDRNNWKVVGIRIDPSATGTSDHMREKYGVPPQIRLVVQPMWVDNDSEVQLGDFAVHLSFNYTKNEGIPYEPDKVAFKKVLDSVVANKQKMKDKGVKYGPSLSIHPGFVKHRLKLSDLLKDFLVANLSEQRRVSKHTSFIGVKPGGHAWVFFGMVKTIKPIYQTFNNRAPGLVGSKLSSRLYGEPNSNFKNHGVSMAPLYGLNVREVNLDNSAVEGQNEPTNRDLPNIVGNPDYSNVFNTDCGSCHTVPPTRFQTELSKHKKYLYKRYDRPDEDESLIPTNPDIFRNFGWFAKGALTRDIGAYVSRRTVNETDSSLVYIKKEYSDKDN